MKNIGKIIGIPNVKKGGTEIPFTAPYCINRLALIFIPDKVQ